jgi:hypothetical protein
MEVVTCGELRGRLSDRQSTSILASDPHSMRETGTLPRVDGTGDRLARNDSYFQVRGSQSASSGLRRGSAGCDGGSFLCFLPSQTPLNLCYPVSLACYLLQFSQGACRSILACYRGRRSVKRRWDSSFCTGLHQSPVRILEERRSY